MSRFKNHYKTLGIHDFASAEEIKSSYRKLARAYHPDLNTHNPKAEDQFKAVNEAYSVLGNTEKRALYDNQLKIMQGVKQTNRSSSQTQPQQHPSDAPKKHSASQAYQKAQTKQKPSPQDKDEKGFQGIFERFLNREPDSSNGNTETQGWGLGDMSQWFQNDIGEKPSSASTKKNLSKQRGEDVTVDTQLNQTESREGVIKTLFIKHHDLCPHCHATGKTNGKLCKKCNGDKTLIRNKKVDVQIPAGVQDGSKVRVAGEGGRGLHGGDHGDLYLLIRTPNDSASSTTNPTSSTSKDISDSSSGNITIQGLDAYSTVTINPEDAVLGTQVTVETLNKPVNMTIPPYTQSGKVFRLKGMGVQEENSSHVGDHYVTITIGTPQKISSEEKALYEKLRQLRPKGDSSDTTKEYF